MPIAWCGPHFGNPPSVQQIKNPEKMTPLDQECKGYKIMKNMGWEDGTPLGCREEGILNPPHIDVTPKKDLHGVGYIPPPTDAQKLWAFNQLKEDDIYQDAIDTYMLSNGPGITDQEKALFDEITMMDLLTIKSGDRESTLMGIDPKDMDEFEDHCNMREAYHRLLAKSPQGGRLEDDLIEGYEGTNGTEVVVLRNRKQFANDSSELDARERIIADVTITKHGPKYFQGICDYGKVYIDLKFTRYVPKIGGKVFCVIGLNGKGTHPWKVYRINM